MAEDQVRRLASGIERAGMRAPAALLLDMLSPLDVISSQLARFGRPLVVGTRADPVLMALEDPDAWAELRRLLSRPD